MPAAMIEATLEEATPGSREVRICRWVLLAPEVFTVKELISFIREKMPNATKQSKIVLLNLVNTHPKTQLRQLCEGREPVSILPTSSMGSEPSNTEAASSVDDIMLLGSSLDDQPLSSFLCPRS